MSDFSEEKLLIRNLYAELDRSGLGQESEVLARYYASNHIWRGYHPFNEQQGAKAVAEVFWTPLHAALKRMQRREDIFMAGANEMDGFRSVWVVSMGHLMGLFDAPWLGITPTGKMVFLRYCEFNRVEDGKITETAMYFDIPHLMI